jgi:hypothetical protein
VFGFTPESVFTFIPEQRSASSRNSVHLEPGIAFTLPRNTQSYYWLAYSWDNLLFCCGDCNKRKGNQFPLADPAKRATHHAMRIEDETPAILKPDGPQDPSDDIHFQGKQPVGLTDLGRKTIEVLGLDSPKHGGRARYFDKLSLKRATWVLHRRSVDPEKRMDAEVARRFLEESLRREMPYCAMATAYLKAHPLPERAERMVRSAGSTVPTTDSGVHS